MVNSLLFLGGSLLSLKSKDGKGLKSLAKSVGHKVSTLPGRGKKKKKEDPFGSIPEQKIQVTKQSVGEADPGVISDDEDEFRVNQYNRKLFIMI